MFVTLSGIVTLVRAVQPENALSPMLVTPLGIVTLGNLLLSSPDGQYAAIKCATFVHPKKA